MWRNQSLLHKETSQVAGCPPPTSLVTEKGGSERLSRQNSGSIVPLNGKSKRPKDPCSTEKTSLSPRQPDESRSGSVSQWSHGPYPDRYNGRSPHTRNSNSFSTSTLSFSSLTCTFLFSSSLLILLPRILLRSGVEGFSQPNPENFY